MHSGPETKVHFKGKNNDYVIFVESAAAAREWIQKTKAGESAGDVRSVVDGKSVFQTNGHGNQGTLDTASNAELESQFGTHKLDDVFSQILLGGNIVETGSAAKNGDRNITQGPSVSHN